MTEDYLKNILDSTRRMAAMVRNRIFAGFFVICAAGLLLVAGAALLWSLFGQQGPSQAGGSGPVFTLKVQVRQVRLDPDRQAVVKVSVIKPETNQFGTFMVGGRPVMTCPGVGACAVDPALHPSALTISAHGDPSQSMSIPLECLAPPAHVPPPCPSADFTLPIDGQPSSYPHDRYFLDATFDVSLADVDVSALSATRARIDVAPLASADAWSIDDIQSAVGPGTAPGSTPGLPQEPTATVGQQANLKRQNGTQIYVWGLSLVPVLFAILFFYLLFLDQRERATELRDFLVALSATTLAVLPLRGVLVPGEIIGLTRVDIVLAFGVAALVATGLAKYAQELWQLKNPPVPFGPTKPVHPADGSAAPDDHA